MTDRKRRTSRRVSADRAGRESRSTREEGEQANQARGLRSSVSGGIAGLRERFQRREEEFTAAHPSPKVKVGRGFASRSSGAHVGMVQDMPEEEGRKKGFLRRIVSQWWDRLLGAASEGRFAEQEEQYAAHQTKRDYVVNSIGHVVWGMAFPFLTIVVTQLTDVERAGMFSFAFTVGTLVMTAANYGVRTYQVSDLDEEHSFSDYQLNRFVTCVVFLLLAWAFCQFRGYDGAMLKIVMGVVIYRVIDSLADVYEGRLQQKDKMYLAGASQLIRSLLAVIVFTVILLFGRNVGAACLAMAITAVVTFVLFTFPVALLETPKSEPMSFSSVGRMFKLCFPIFAALILYTLIDNVPKFVMEISLAYDNQLYFNALYFPSHAILLTVGLIYKPQLVRMAATWIDPERRGRFDLIVVVMLLGILAITVVVGVFMSVIGLDIMSVLYGFDFHDYEFLSYLMIAAGGLIGAIDFLYQVITIMRRQELVTRSYLIVFAVSIVASLILVNLLKLQGAIISYVVVMAALCVILLWVYVSERINVKRHPERDMALLLSAPPAEVVDAAGVNSALHGYGERVAGEYVKAGRSMSHKASRGNRDGTSGSSSGTDSRQTSRSGRHAKTGGRQGPRS